MQLIETLVTESAVYMRYADETDPEKVTQWLEFHVQLPALKHPNNPLQELLQVAKLERLHLGTIRLSAIMHIQEILKQQESALRAATQS